MRYAGLAPTLVRSGAPWGIFFFFSYVHAKQRYQWQQASRAAVGAQALRLGSSITPGGGGRGGGRRLLPLKPHLGRRDPAAAAARGGGPRPSLATW